MARPKISAEQKKLEGEAVRRFFHQAKINDPSLTQEALIAELGCTQGLFSQWLTGRTAIPDRSLIWLSKRLKFSATEVRPCLIDYLEDLTPQEIAVLRAYREDDSFQKVVNAIAETSPFYLKHPKPIDK